MIDHFEGLVFERVVEIVTLKKCYCRNLNSNISSETLPIIIYHLNEYKKKKKSFGTKRRLIHTSTRSGVIKVKVQRRHV